MHRKLRDWTFCVLGGAGVGGLNADAVRPSPQRSLPIRFTDRPGMCTTDDRLDKFQGDAWGAHPNAHPHGVQR